MVGSVTEGAKQVDVLLRGGVGCKLRVAWSQWGLEVEAVFMCRGGEEVELPVDVVQALGQHVDNAPA